MYPFFLLSKNILKKRYNNIIGLSDHSSGILAPTIATLLGASIIEKHITLDRTMKGTDQIGSLEYNGLDKLQIYISDIPKYLGTFDKKVENNILMTKNKLMKSLTSKVGIKKGMVLTEDMFCLKCPGHGILWKNKDKILGKKALKDIENDTTLLLEWFE